MNKNNEAKLDMYDAVLNYCDANPAIVATVPAFQADIAHFKTIASEIHATAQLETSVITGITADKLQMSLALCAQAADLSAAVFSYGVATENHELQEQVKFSITDLKRLKAGSIVATCNNILAAANANLAALAGYGITAASLTTFTNAINNYIAKIAMPRNAMSLRAHYASLLKDLFKQGDGVLKNQADKLINQFKTAHAEFYDVYRNNRIIVDPGISSTHIMGTITDSTTAALLEAATVLVVEQSLTTTTDIHGVYTLKTPATGIVSLKITKAGYIDKTITGILIKLGKTTVTDVPLKAV